MLTLNYFKTHPLRMPKARDDLTIGKMRTAEKKDALPDQIHPTAGAYIHYGGVELADTIYMLKPQLDADELQLLTASWYVSCGRVCKQLLFYTWQICSKEMRHGSSAKCDKAFSGWESYGEPGMQEAMALCHSISDGGSYTNKLDTKSGVLVAPYMKAVERQFRKGGWGGAYGGPKWADITLEMVRYFYGETSAMLAADRLWSAVHNTGPIFNKGFYFTTHDGNLMNVLNAQANTSVFKLGDPATFLSKSGYQHQVSKDFIVFAGLALAAIHKVNPDYKLGDTGGLNSDGTKADGVPAKGASSGKAGSVSFGPYSYTPADRESLQ